MLYEKKYSKRGAAQSLIGQWLDTKILVLLDCGIQSKRELIEQSEEIKQNWKEQKTLRSVSQ